MMGMGKSIVRSSGSQLFMVCGPVSKTLNTCCLLLINRALRYHGRVFSKGPGNRSVASKGNRGLRFRNPGLRHQLKCFAEALHNCTHVRARRVAFIFLSNIYTCGVQSSYVHLLIIRCPLWKTGYLVKMQKGLLNGPIFLSFFHQLIYDINRVVW